MQMKSILIAIFIISFSLSCKKGSQDPNFSFRTRKARVTGKWQIKSGTSRYTEEGSGAPYSESFTFDETKYLYNDNPNYYYTGGHSLTMNFEKSGACTITEMFDGMSNAYVGTWDFNKGIGDKKSKEQLLIHFTSRVNGNNTYSYKGNFTDITYDIYELRNEKMVLFAKYKTIYPDGTSKSYEDNYTMQQK